MSDPIHRRSLTPNLAPLLRRRLTPAAQRALREAGVLADRLGCGLYLVGGAVRDLLLGRPQIDLDLTVEGDGLDFARRLARRWRGTAVLHPGFLTATVTRPDGLKLDVAAARREEYPRPAALPRVFPAPLRDDAFRRDVTINSMAVQLNAKHFGRLHDPFGGRRDLAAGRVRVLHARSFTDDPTRVFRAVRFEQRYGFRLEARTARRLRAEVRGGGLARLSAARLQRELELVLTEREPWRALGRLARFGALGWLHPSLDRQAWGPRAWLDAEDAFLLLHLPEPPDRPLLRWFTLLDPLTPDQARRAAARLRWSRKLRQALHVQKRAGEALRRRLLARRTLTPAEGEARMRDLPVEVLLFERSKLPAAHPARAWIDAYLLEWRWVKPLCTGQDLLRLGYPAGPRYAKVLRALRAARLDGRVATRADEERWITKNFRR